MAREQFAAVEMILNMIQGKTDGVSRVDFHPQKGEYPKGVKYEQPFLRASPESQGISSARLSGLIRDLTGDKKIDLHHLMVLRHGKMICECHVAPYRGEIWHIAHSMCKSITGMAIGLLIDEGKLSLDENIYKIFEERMKPRRKRFRPAVTVENLLTMTSGVQFNESGIVSGNDWLGGFLNASVREKPGTVFQYNSMNSYVLSAIVTERTGLTLTEYLRPRLFIPLGIKNFLWETCPSGITKGGWGLFLCPEDMAKLGQLYLKKGKWNGVSLIPETWVTESTRKHVESSEGTYGYGYQIWRENRPDSFEFNGMLGQNVIVYPDIDMVLVTCAGSNKLFQDCSLLDIVRRHFPVDYRPEDYSQDKKMKEDVSGQYFLSRQIRRAGARESEGADIRIRRGGWPKKSGNCTKNNSLDISGFLKKIDGRCYLMDPQSTGLFPLLLQVMQNNLTQGIRKAAFRRESGEFWFMVLEGESWHQIKVGFKQAEETWLKIHEESFLISTKGELAFDEDHTPVLKLDIAFLEEAVRREIKILFIDDRIEMRCFETPGKDLILEGLSSVMDEMKNSLMFGRFKGKKGDELIRILLERTIEPVAKGVRDFD